MREVLENCGEGTAFTHGEAVTAFLEFRETCESVLRLLAAATRKSGHRTGRLMRPTEYFTPDRPETLRLAHGGHRQTREGLRAGCD